MRRGQTHLGDSDGRPELKRQRCEPCRQHAPSTPTTQCPICRYRPHRWRVGCLGRCAVRRWADGGVQRAIPSEARLAADRRSLLIEKCPGCIVCARSLLSASCLLEFGVCGCVYHAHCLAPWLAKRWVCPVDEREWVASTPHLDCTGFVGVSRQEYYRLGVASTPQVSTTQGSPV